MTPRAVWPRTRCLKPPRRPCPSGSRDDKVRASWRCHMRWGRTLGALSLRTPSRSGFYQYPGRPASSFQREALPCRGSVCFSHSHTSDELALCSCEGLRALTGRWGMRLIQEHRALRGLGPGSLVRPPRPKQRLWVAALFRARILETPCPGPSPIFHHLAAVTLGKLLHLFGPRFPHL